MISFNTQRRLLLTGTPLQNSLMELWALMHFLMPHIFTNRAEFSYWFSNPLNNMIENNSGVNRGLIRRLHSIMRPFLLRRLKKDVAKQLPKKYEHVVYCPLSRRQQYLYEEFLSRSATRAALTGGNFMGMMNILMQLRKVCNHPDLFEPRPIKAPLILEPICARYPKLVRRAAAAGLFDFVSSPGAIDLTASLREQKLRLPLDAVPRGNGRAKIDAERFEALTRFIQVDDVALKPEDEACLAEDPAMARVFAALRKQERKESMRRRRELFYVNEGRCQENFYAAAREIAWRVGGIY
eukprot:CAMPEP_0118875564 /NCGR_PEP_ID=MMETSP1163-20130328/16595_1 /TAXON_ID=124430 /ORGANISM="Phaeomonas parva, Strain CCMP2877" /LENGTH=295 /DNA_ID=CAMNT_0006811083 /DNA_START=10 /DNA_END=894 /DNA_ORIENTATION=-